MYIPDRYPPNSTWPQGQGRPMSGHPNMLKWKKLNLHKILFLKKSFESSRAMPGNPS